jgi:phosphoribosylanthranilate isomerase
VQAPTRPPFVKVCCIASVEEAEFAIAAGASALGLVSAMPSGPGVIDDALIAEIAARVPPPIATFLLTSRQEADAVLEQHEKCRTTTLQLVDHVPIVELKKLRAKLPGIKLVQVIHVDGEGSIDEALAVAPHVDALLLDSGNRRLPVKLLGGTGRTHDWRVSRRIRESVAVPVFLAGGLNERNVADAVEAVAPHGLDLCSSVRTEGRLDRAKLLAFMAAVQRTTSAGLALVTLVVPDYDAAIAFFTSALGFTLREDTLLGNGKRWVVVAPPNGRGAALLLARAVDAEQRASIGRQTGGRVGFFLETDDFAADHAHMLAVSVRFIEAPRHEAYGTVAVFLDLCGNPWDLLQRRAGFSAAPPNPG